MMLQQRLIPLSDQRDWENCLKEIPHAPAHRWSYHHALNKSSHLPTYLYYAKASNFQAICPLSIRRKFNKKDIVTPYGFGGFVSEGEYLNFDQYWQDYLQQQDFVCGYIALHPILQSHQIFSKNSLREGGLIYIIDLQQSLDEIFSSFSKVHRYELRQYANEIITDKKILAPAIFSLHQQTLERVDAASVYHFSAETLQGLIDDEHTIAIGISQNGNIEALALFIYTPQTADYFLNISSLNGRHYSRLLIWEGIKKLKELGVAQLNLGGGIKTGDALEQFKRRFGGKPQTFRVLIQIYDTPSFNQLCQQTTINPNYFPPYYSP